MPRDSERDRVDRRNVLRGLGAVGTAGLVGLAGCTTEQADGGDGGGDGGDDTATEGEMDGNESDAGETTEMDTGPDAVVVIGYPESGVQLFKDYYSSFDTGTQFLVTDGLRSTDLPSDVGNPMTNVQGTAPRAAGPGREFFVSQFEAEYGSQPQGSFPPYAYDASACLVLANVLAGENDGIGVRENFRAVANPGGEQFGPENLAEAVEAAAAGQNVDYVGASSAVGFDENGDTAAAVYELFSFNQDGVTTEEEISFGSSGIPEPEPAGSGSDSGRDDVRYGVLQPETGDLGSLGTPIAQAGALVASQLNGADTGFTFDARRADTQTSAQAGISAAESLVNAGYPGVCGAASSTVSLQVYQQALIPNDVVGCSPASTSPRITNLDDNDLIYRTPPTDALQGQVLAQVASENLDASTASTMYVNNDYGQALSDVFVESFSGMNGEVLAQVAFEKGQSSYTSKLSDALDQ